jgi:hypothetical protein
MGGIVQSNRMISATEVPNILNALNIKRVWDKIMNEICSEFTNGKME